MDSNQITFLISVFAVVVANVGTVIALFLHSDKKMEENRRESDKKMEEARKETNSILNAINQEMKDFHGRLERQDAQFKQNFLLLEEKMRK